MDSDLPNVPTGHPADEASKRALLRVLPVIIIERCWVTISPDGTAEPDFIPRDAAVRVTLDFTKKQRPEIVLSTTVPAVVYFNNAVFICKEPVEFYRKDVIGGWSDLIVGL